MLHSGMTLIGMAIEARDGRIGKVADAYFDDMDWTVRYLVVDTGHWLTGPSVLITPHSVRNADFVRKLLPVDLTRDQVRSAPRSETEPPVSRQFEKEYYDYYGYPYYWEGPYLWGGTSGPYYYAPAFPPPASVTPPGMEALRRSAREEGQDRKGDPHLRSIRAMKGYHVEATDGRLGTVEDLLLSEEDWRFAYLGVDTRPWLPGRSIAVPSEWARSIRWEVQAVDLDHAREDVSEAPHHHHGSPITAEYQAELEWFYHAAERKL